MTGTNGAIAAILAIAVVVGNVSASESESETPVKTEKAEIFVGAGAVISSKPYDGVDSKVYPVPIFGYEGERLYLRGISGGYRLFKRGGWSIGPMLRPRFEGYSSGDSSALAGMGSRNLTLDGGVDLSLRTKWGLFGVQFVTDLLGAHDGQELEASYTAMFPYAGFDFIPSVALRWHSDNLLDYYYGVTTSEARAGRPAYAPDDTISPAIRLAVRRELSSHWGLLLGFQYEWLDNEISDSPIVDDDTTLSLLLGATYTF